MNSSPLNTLGIPPLAGISTYLEAGRPGYSIEQSVNLLKRYNYVTSRLNAIAAAHLAHTPEWEVKSALSLHLWLDAEHSAAFRRRVAEMHEPPLHLDEVPDPSLEIWLDEVVRAENTIELLVGIYRVVRPELLRAWRKHLAETNPLADHPTCRLLRLFLPEEDEMTAWGDQALSALLQAEEAAEMARSWQTHLQTFLEAAGGLPADLTPSADSPLPPSRSDGRPYSMDVVPRRDARFIDPFNRAFTFRDKSRDDDTRALVLLYQRVREMDVPEWMAPIIYKTHGKPWEYYQDMSRQLWDEARHSMMGEVGLHQINVRFYDVPIELQSSMSLNMEFDPLEAHIVLWGVEQELMKRETGKPREFAQAQASGNRLLATFQDYDWADEVLHAQYGRRWLVGEIGSLTKLWAAYQALAPRWDESMARLDSRSQQTDWWPAFVERVRPPAAASHN